MRNSTRAVSTPTGPMVRLLRRIAKGDKIPVVAPDPAARGYARILLNLVERRMIEPDGESGQRVYRVTASGREVIADARSTATA